MESVTLETYPDAFTDYEKYIENEEYDSTIRKFTVPMYWAVDWVFIEFRMGWEEFLEVYTWDDTFKMYEDAKQKNVLISEEIDNR